MQDRLLISQDVAADASDRFEIGRIGRLTGFAKLLRRNPDLAGRERRAVDPAGVIEHGIEPARGDVRADPLDDLLRRKWLAECRDSARAPPGLTTLPSGLSSRLSSAIARRASSLEQSIRRIAIATGKTRLFGGMTVEFVRSRHLPLPC